MARIGPPVGAVSADSLIRACCRSSVVEHSIGNGEVDSSILSGSTSFFNIINACRESVATLPADLWHLHAEQSTKWCALPCKIRAVGSRAVLTRFLVA